MHWPAFSTATFLSTFGIIFIAELPDKTALAALMLASRYRMRDVILGTWLAFLVQTLVALAAGGLLRILPAMPVQIASGIGFLVFAVLAFRRKEEGAEGDDTPSRHDTMPVWLMSFLVIFIAEWGDLTQLATAALVARGGDVLSVGLGSVLALWAVTVIAAYSGKQMSRFLKPRILNLVSGVLFTVIGLYVIGHALMH